MPPSAPDGTSGTHFGLRELSKLAFDDAAERLYALDRSVPGIFGFDASSPPAFPPLGAFDPLPVAEPGNLPGLAVDNTALPSAGNIYLASRETNLLYGFDDSGTLLPGFPVDPAIAPGAPGGSPKDLCGAAVDSAGNVWVSNSAGKRILEYSSAGSYLSSIDTSAQGAPCQLAFDSSDDLYVTQPQGVYKYTAASSYTAATQIAASEPGGAAIAVDPTNDHLYVAIGDTCVMAEDCLSSGPSFMNWVDEYDGAGNLIDEHSLSSRTPGIAVDAGGDAYVTGEDQIRVIGPGFLLAEARSKPTSALANTSATLNGTINTQGVALSDCHFEFVSQLAFGTHGFTDLSSGGSAPCEPGAGSIPLDLEEHPVSAPASGLQPDTTYRFRLLATNANGTASAEGSLTTPGPAEVKTTGAPVRTTTSARLSGRVYPVRAATTYHFEYGTEGPCNANPCASTPDMPAGSGDLTKLVAEQIEGLQPGTTYHYRLVADNGNPAGASFGSDTTVTTRASEELPGQSNRFPGPPGSDRAWELVSMADSGGNPVGLSQGFSDNGDRAVYSIAGGTPISNSGSFFSLYYAERPPGAHPQSGWQAKLITPARADLAGPDWGRLYGANDLSNMVAGNGVQGHGPLWRLNPAAQQPQLLVKPLPPQQFGGGTVPYGASGDGTRVVASLQGGSLDPVYPGAAAKSNLYDVDTNPPTLLGLMPDGTPACSAGLFDQASHWISEDGSDVYFSSQGDECSGPSQLYVRDVPAQQTRLISGPPLSGPSCGARFLKGTPGAAFFATPDRLSADDIDPQGSCEKGEGNDVYRYDLATGKLDCVTCLAPGIATNVLGSTFKEIVVSDDGSRLYFNTQTPLLPAGGVYRLNLTSGDLTRLPVGISINPENSNLSGDGSRLVFSSSSAALNPLGGTSDNGGTNQYYLYDDTDGSITCVSCPSDGSAPLASVSSLLVDQSPESLGQPNLDALASDGTFAFATETPLAGADQNTPGPGHDLTSGSDIYEWRDGRQILVTDGLTNWVVPPTVEGVSTSGGDIFFDATAQYTEDAIDANRRVYDARIDGGIEFPPPPKPCPLEVCQGTPKGAPEEPNPSSASFAGHGNATAPAASRCPKGRARRKGRCVTPKHKKRHHKGAQRPTANHNRRAAR